MVTVEMMANTLSCILSSAAAVMSVITSIYSVDVGS